MQELESNEQSQTELSSWLPLEEFSSKYQQFNINQLRWLLRKREYNGLNKAVRRVGRKIYLHEGLFAEWLHEQSSS